jgi:hypothetical protein
VKDVEAPRASEGGPVTSTAPAHDRGAEPRARIPDESTGRQSRIASHRIVSHRPAVFASLLRLSDRVAGPAPRGR